MKHNSSRHGEIRLGTHGEDYGNWMPVSMLRLVGGLAALAAVFSALFFSVFHITVLGVVFMIAALLLLALLLWITWIRRQYAFGGGGMMEQVHQIVLSHLDFDGQGQLLEVGCGSGALSIRAVLTWRVAQVVGIDYWGSAYGYGQAMCEKNARSEGVAARCRFRHGDANKLDFPDESFDAVVSNYVYHNITGADKRTLLRETLRVLKKRRRVRPQRRHETPDVRGYGGVRPGTAGHGLCGCVAHRHGPGGLWFPPPGGHDDAG